LLTNAIHLLGLIAIVALAISGIIALLRWPSCAHRARNWRASRAENKRIDAMLRQERREEALRRRRSEFVRDDWL
jgi:hypothetical protein